MKLPRLMICLLGTLLALLLGLPANAARLALVIGNKDYRVGALKNPVNDAQAISQTLAELGFAVTTVKNLRRDDIGRTVEGFASRIRAGDDVVVFYAGHGVQVKGINYLPAVDANIAVESDVALNSLNLNQLLERLDEAKSGVRLLLIDACRDNPYSRSFRSGSRGLARVEGAPSGTLMHFATRPGGVASDGSTGNGLYTSELLKHLKAPGLPVESMLKRVAAGVKQASSGEQQPWTEGALDGEFYFAPGGIAPVALPIQITSLRPEPVQQPAPQAVFVQLEPQHPATVAAFAQVKWDLASAYPASNFHSENLVQFANDVDKATAGKLKITVHANAALFKAPEIKRAVQGGQAQAGEILLVNFQNEWQIFGTDGLPFLADSYDESNKLYKAQKPALEKKLAEQGMNLLYAVAWPPQGIYSKKPLASAADLKGIKWRAYSPATSRIAELVGAQPVTVQAAELSQAFATGVVEATMTSGASGVDSKLYENLKYYYDMQAWLPKNAVIVNKAAFDALDKPTQAVVLKAAADAEVRGLAASKRVNVESIEKLKANGMSIIVPSAQLKADMKKVGDTMLKEWLEKSGPEGKAVVDAFSKP